jgi:N-dimethylarginine dimethylaminohydrolase
MTVNTINEWGKLKEIIVGRVPDKYIIPVVKKTAFTINDISLIKKCSEEVFPGRMLRESQKEIENLCKIIKKFGAKVLRPKQDHVGKIYTTPYHHGIGEIVYNARDLVLIVGNKIIECPSQEKYRLFETYGYYDIFQNYFKKGAQWISAPKPRIDKQNLVNKKKGNKKFQKLLNNEISFEAANILKLGKDLLYLVSRSGNKLGAQWLQQVVGSDYKVHLTEGIYGGSHIDSTIMALKPGLVLLNGSRVNIKNCPKILKNWKKIFFEEIIETPKKIINFHNKVRKKNYQILKKRNLFSDINHMASSWIGMNFLSLDKNTIVVDEIQTKLIKLLEKIKFNVIPIKFSNSYFLKGGLHCCTLDTIRKSE